MRKSFSLIAVFILLITLCSCTTVEKGVILSQNRSCVRSVEIYYQEYAYGEGNIHRLREEIRPIVILNPDAHSTFLDRLESLEFEEERSLLPIPTDGGYDYSGYIVAIVYSDGGYDLFAQKGSYSFAIGEDGQEKHKYGHADYCGEIPWSELVTDYTKH